ncbi:MAG: serine/threonine protein kinase [Labilithrix sp.]|nr:serine/threonine protein kinase [Labilithrix sp.]MCW5814785.1 serine/threonine protein kinase [Labilithrix sp.]
MLKPGQVVDRYELVCPIGEGGMATVWAARERDGAGRLVALKMIHSRFAEDPSFRAMFLDEATIVAAIEHPNVAKVYEHTAQADRLYLAMEYVDGDSFFSLVSQHRTAPVAVALHVVAEVCAGLHAAHSVVGPDGAPRNVVHRDVSPQNVLLSLDGRVRIIDFGIAHARDRHAHSTALGTIKGKIRYMSPEQARREEIGPWTDVFGAGAMLFRALVGSTPYAANTDLVTMQALLAAAPPLVPLPADMRPEIAQVIQQAIAPNVADRFRSAEALRRALLGLLAELSEIPDLPAFVDARMSEQARQRHALLGRAQVVPDLAPPAVKRTPQGTALMAPLAPLAPEPAPAIKSTALMPTRPDGKREPPPPEPASSDPGFMDVRAIVEGRVPDLPAPEHRPANEGRSLAQPQTPQKLELQFEPKNRAAAPVKSGVPRIAILVISAVILVVVFFIALPLIVKNRAIATAHDAGFEMTIERTGVGLGTATFRGVKLKPIRVPGVSADVDELFVSGFSMKELRAIGAHVHLDGAPADFEMGLGLVLSENRVRFAGTPQAPRRFTVAGGTIEWKGPGGAGFEAGDVGLEVESRGNGNEDVKGSIGRFFYKTGKTSIGPWGASLESGPQGSRFRLALDPALPDGPSVLVVASPSAPVRITVKIARSPIANLGLKPAEVGLPADASTEIETYLEGEIAQDGKMSLVGPTSLWGLKVKDLKKPIDVKIEGGVSGIAGQPLDIDSMLVSFGPFSAVVTGTITPDKGNLRVDALAKANPIPCEKLARMEAKTMGSFVQMLQAFGESTGALRIRGEVNASCAVKYDSADPDATSVTWLAKETCGLSIFGL